MVTGCQRRLCPGYTGTMKAAPAALLLLVLAGAMAPAVAQYAWTDNNGRKVFSDRPPPMDIPERSVIRQPGAPAKPGVPAVTSMPTAPVPPQVSAVTAPVRPTLPRRDGELEERVRQTEAADAAKRKTEEGRLAAARADNCQRARQAAAAFDSGVRLAQVNAQGERSFMDDATRAAEVQRAQSVMASDCR